MDKKNGNMLRIIVTILGLLGIGVGIVIGYTNMGHQVGDNCKEISEIKPMLAEHDKYIVGKKAEEPYLQEKIQKIERSITAIDLKQETILDKIKELQK